MKDSKRMVKLITSLVLTSYLSACSVIGPSADELNPFNDGSQHKDFGGQRNTSALGGTAASGKEADAARHALEVMGTYRKAQSPEPNYPVMQPAEVRLMWVPDHLNAVGDLVPAHYYYLRVLPDRPAVTDAFEIERQLDLSQNGAAVGSVGGGGFGGSSATPWVYKEVK